MPTGFNYLERGQGKPAVLCLHGLFGSPENWQSVMEELEDEFHLISLFLPLHYRDGVLSAKTPTIDQLTVYIADFLSYKGIDKVAICGNSLGGQVAIDFSRRFEERVKALILTGSAGLLERNLAGGKFIRVSRKFIAQQAAMVLFNPSIITPAFIEDIYATLSDRRQRLFLVRLAKAASNFEVKSLLPQLKGPVLLIWGRNDRITPPEVAYEFLAGLQRAELAFIDSCGHSPPLEQPRLFGKKLRRFLKNLHLEQ